MMLHRSGILLTFFLATILGAAAADNRVLWPGSGPDPVPQAAAKAFQMSASGGSIDVDFNDIANSDDYIQIDLGPVTDLANYLPGGYIEATADIDKPILRIAFSLADPADFWNTRIHLEFPAPLVTGSHPYRFYLDNVPAYVIAPGKDHLYLELHDLGGAARGEARARITSVTLSPQTADWQTEKTKIYLDQFQLLTFDKIEPLYYAHYENAVDWDSIAFDPGLSRIPLDGTWKKSFVGEKSWDYAYLADESPAQPNYNDSSWTATTVPEPATPDQQGGYYWYRREVDVPADVLKGKVYLRCDDLSEAGRLYVNGKLAGTQASVLEEWQWIVENGTRSPKTQGVPVKQAATWGLFERLGIPFPFDLSALPDDAKRLYLPIFSGEYKWPYAYDVTGLLVPGRNVIAARIYGDPLRGWWIYKNRNDRAAQNVFGLLGSVYLAASPGPTIERFVRIPPEKVADDGTAVHGFDCTVVGNAAKVRFLCEGNVQTVPVVGGKAHADFTLSARFTDYRARAVLLDQQDQPLHEEEIAFNGVVVDIKDRVLRVNGEPYDIRGVNSDVGIEQGTVTRREFLRKLRFYQQEGINALRINQLQPWQLQAAFDAGMMVMPCTTAGSTDLDIGALGDLENPDYRLATDRHRNLATLIGQAPNILIWNGANELWHTAGYSDREILQKYLVAIRDAFRAGDPYHRPVTFANLDVLQDNWIFYDGQDVVGWNIYSVPVKSAHDAPIIFQGAGDKPLVFTEWGTHGGKKDRDGKIDAWEAEMRSKWDIISKTPGSAGGFLFPFHGEFEDERGRAFIRELYLLFSFEKNGDKWTFTNKSAAPMRDVSFIFISDGIDVPRTRYAIEIKAGGTFDVDPPDNFTGTVEIRYDTHYGLKHFFTQHIQGP